MRRFLSRALPDLRRLLVVESGSRHLVNGFLANWLEREGRVLSCDLVTCFTGAAPHYNAVFRVQDYVIPEARRALLTELRGNRYDAIAILCSGEPIMTRWKWFLAARVPAKLLILNENGDYFWADRGNFGIIAHFALYRAGLTGASAVLTPLRILVFPLVLAYLAGYAAWAHLRRRQV